MTDAMSGFLLLLLHLHRLTIRKRLEVLSNQCENIQKERDNLKNALTEREKEISELLRFVHAHEVEHVVRCSRNNELTSYR